jgi:ribosomal protein S18 acetylase RimI-like enzyme
MAPMQARVTDAAALVCCCQCASTLHGANPVHFSTANDADLEAVAALVNSAYRGDSSRAGWTTEADLVGGQRTDVASLRAELAGRPGAVLLLLRDEAEGDLLGSVWLEPREPDLWYLGMLTVRPDLQARRLGRTLLTEAESYASARGARRMRMRVITVRDVLIAWYERRGYARTGETVSFPYGDERFGVPLRDDLVFEILEKRLERSC